MYRQKEKKRKEKNRIPQYLFDIRAEKIEYCFEERKFEFNDPPVINNSTFDLSPPPIRAERFETLVRTRCKCNISVEQGEREREREKRQLNYACEKWRFMFIILQRCNLCTVRLKQTFKTTTSGAARAKLVKQRFIVRKRKNSRFSTFFVSR